MEQPVQNSDDWFGQEIRLIDTSDPELGSAPPLDVPRSHSIGSPPAGMAQSYVIVTPVG